MNQSVLPIVTKVRSGLLPRTCMSLRNRRRTIVFLLVVTAAAVATFSSGVFFANFHTGDPSIQNLSRGSGVIDDDLIAKYMSGSMLDVPPEIGPPALPSVQISAKEEIDRKGYGGKGDAPHLGGFTDLDGEGIVPSLWKNMIEYYGIKSLVDIGCGKGLSTAWFILQGVDAQCAEGSHDAVTQNVFGRVGISEEETARRVTEHDFSRGPWWPSGPTVDAVWAVEFLEHVGRNYFRNYFPILKKAAVLFLTHSTWGGWHHVEVHDDTWWKSRLEGHGFVYSQDLTQRARSFQVRGHIRRSMMVFLNPAVLSLPAHSHLFAEPGCFDNYGKPGVDCGVHKRAKTDTKLPDDYFPIKFNQEQEDKWKSMLAKIQRDDKEKKDIEKQTKS